MTDEQIKHMVDRFLGWKLPKTLAPDGGIKFEKFVNGQERSDGWWPTGTNFLDASQATEMVRYMLEGMSAQPGSVDERVWRCFHCDERFTDRGLAAEHFGYEGDEPACKLNEQEGGLAAALHTAEKALYAYRYEDTERDRDYHALAAKLTVVSREQEEKGYERGLADGRAISDKEARVKESERDTLSRYRAALQDIAMSEAIPTPIKAWEWCRDVAQEALSPTAPTTAGEEG